MKKKYNGLIALLVMVGGIALAVGLIAGIAIGLVINNESEQATLQSVEFEEFDFSRIDDEAYVTLWMSRAFALTGMISAENTLAENAKEIESAETLVESIEKILEKLPEDSEIYQFVVETNKNNEKMLESLKKDREDNLKLYTNMKELYNSTESMMNLISN